MKNLAQHFRGCQLKHCLHMLDDCLFIGPPNSSECHKSLLAFHVLAKDLGLPIKSEKTEENCISMHFINFFGP